MRKSKQNQEDNVGYHLPLSIAQWVRAFNDPNSIIFKTIMGELKHEADYQYSLEVMLNRISQESIQKKQQERQQFFANIIAAEKLLEKNYYQRIFNHERAEAKKIEQLITESHRVHMEQVDQWSKEIQTAFKEKGVLLKEMGDIRKQMTGVSDRLENRQRENDKTLRQEISIGAIPIMRMVGQEQKQLDPQEAVKILEALPKLAPLHEVIERNPGLRAELLHLWEHNEDPSKTLNAKQDVHRQILSFAALNGDDEGKNLPSFIRLNKALDKAMGEMSKKNSEPNAEDIRKLLKLTAEYQQKATKLDDKLQTIVQMTDKLKAALAVLEKDDVKHKP